MGGGLGQTIQEESQLDGRKEIEEVSQEKKKWGAKTTDKAGCGTLQNARTLEKKGRQQGPSGERLLPEKYQQNKGYHSSDK